MLPKFTISKIGKSNGEIKWDWSLDTNLNLFVDRIYRIDWIFLFPHFPEENKEGPSDFVGKVGPATVPTYLGGHGGPPYFNFASSIAAGD